MRQLHAPIEVATLNGKHAFYEVFLTNGRAALGRFQAFMALQKSCPLDLPLLHTTNAYSFVDICVGDDLVPTVCDVFKKEILYFFYGRPAYRVRDGANAHIEFSWPIVFIVDPAKVARISAVYPFDTGAFYRRLYEEFFDRKSKLDDFKLEPTLESAKKLVQTFYDTNRSYYSGRSRKNIDIPMMQFEAQGIQELSRLPGIQTGSVRRDERSSAIEIQLEESLSIKDTIIAIVLPQQYLSLSVVIEALDRWEVKRRLYYEVLHNQTGDAWVGQIYGLIAKLFEDLGYFEMTTS